MSKNRKKIVEAIQNISAPSEDAIMSGYVKEVDEAKATMRVVLNISGQVIEGVMLHALGGSLKGMVIIPEQDSDVVICSVDGSGEYMLVQADKIKKVIWDIGTEIDIRCDKIVFNGGNNGGMVLIEKLKENLKTLKDYVKETLEPAIHTAISEAKSTYSLSQLCDSHFQTTISAATITFEDMENLKIEH